MKLEKEHWRAMMFYDFKSGLKQQESLERLKQAFGDEAPSRATVYNWFAEFRRHRETLEDGERTGRPCSATTEENVTAVRKLVEDDARVTTALIAAQLQISSGTVTSILHDCLGLSKVSCRWIPHILTPDQKRGRVSWCQSMLRRFDGGESRAVWDIVSGDETWVYTFDPESKQQSFQWTPVGSPPPLKATRSRSVTKQMIAVFIARSGFICCVPLKEQRTVTAAWYTRVCLPRLLDAVSEKRPKTKHRGLLLHQDNAPAHKAHLTQDFLTQQRLQQLQHPPYSPDLAPCDFFVFPRVKKTLRGIRFDSPDTAVEAFVDGLNSITSFEWSHCFHQWFHRMNRCVEVAGEYFEKM